MKLRKFMQIAQSCIASQWENLPMNPVLFDLRPDHWWEKWDKNIHLYAYVAKVNPFHIPPQHIGRLHFPASLANRWDRMMGFWPEECCGSNLCNFLPGPQNLMYSSSHSLSFLLLSDVEDCEAIRVVDPIKGRTSGPWRPWWCRAHCWPLRSVIWMRNKLSWC